jgi:hypothetical protein
MSISLIQEGRIKMKKKIFGFILLFLYADILFANNLPNPKSLALGDAFLTKASGFQSLDWNPANLGLRENFITLNLFQVNSDVSNNSFSLKFYNNTVGDSLDDGEEQDLLNRIPDSGFGIDTDVSLCVPITSFSVNLPFGNFALSTSGISSASIGISKELFNFVINDIEFDKYDFPNNKGEAVAFIETKFGYGERLPIERFSYLSAVSEDLPPIYAGLGFGYIFGLGYAKITDCQSSFNNSADGMTLDSKLTIRTAGYNTDESELSGGQAGKGFRANIGFYSQINENISAGLTLNNLFGGIKWRKNCEEHLVSVYGDSLFLYSEEGFDSLVTDTDTTYSISSFKQRIPFEFHLGGSYKLKNYDFYLDYVQGFDNSAFTSAKPKISLGAEYYPLGWLPLRAGIGFGGGRPSHFSFGYGLEFKNFEFNFGLRNYGSPLPGYTKGMAFSLGTMLKF